MPKIRPGMRRPPPGFDLINDKLDEFEAEMRLALSEDPSQAPLPGKNAKTSQAPARAGEPLNSTDGEAETAVDSLPNTDAEAERAVPPLWRLARINQDRTRYVFNACYRDKSITPELLQYCCEMHFIDAGLVRRWQLPGYERLCCTACCVPGTAGVAARMVTKFANRDKSERRKGSDGNQNDGTCICRVPAEKRRVRHFSGCTVCGCVGCGSGDKRPREDVKSGQQDDINKTARTEEEEGEVKASSET